MLEREIDLTTADGEMNTFVVHPEEGPPRPVVLFLMDAPGMREELRNMCRRLASAGYFVMASNLYYRQVRSYNVFETGDRDRMYELMGSLTNAMVTEDAKGMLEWAASRPAANSDSVGVVGYCMSGPFTVLIGAALSKQVKAVASIHGVALATEAQDSPHRHLDELSAEVYVACAEHDEHITSESIADFEAALVKSSTKGRVEWYPGTEHGFSFVERTLYDRDASERHWERLHDLFQRNLP